MSNRAVGMPRLGPNVNASRAEYISIRGLNGRNRDLMGNCRSHGRSDHTRNFGRGNIMSRVEFNNVYFKQMQIPQLTRFLLLEVYLGKRFFE